jgi:methylmalonyl-CoA/ethylmalonyl-CoA epimerase
MSQPRLDHIGVAVADLEAAMEIYRKLGFTTGPVEELAPQGVRLSFCPLGGGGGRIELLAALGPETAIGKYLAANGGRGGIHHLCFAVDDIRAEMARLAAEGFALIDREPRQGAHGALVAFLHPRATAGVLIELSEKKD